MIYHALVATDEAFAMPTAVTLRSLFTVSDGPFHVTILHDSIAAAIRDRVLHSIPEGDHEIEWVDASEFQTPAIRNSHLPASTLFRISGCEAVPSTAERVLYLDVDTLIRQDPIALWSTDLGDDAVAAVRSVNYPFVATYGAVNHWRDLGLEPSVPFFNAGVILIDSAKWRAQEVRDRAFEYLRSPFLGGGADQEALNVALAGRWTQLPPTWNQQTALLSDQRGAPLIFTEEQLLTARSNPAIVHFQERPKPWHRGCTHPWQNEWLSRAMATDFRQVQNLRQRSLREEARWRLKRAASALVKGR